MLAKDTTPCKPQVLGERERLRMVMRPKKIKEIIATGGKFGDAGRFFLMVGGFFYLVAVHLEFFGSRLLYKFSMNG